MKKMFSLLIIVCSVSSILAQSMSSFLILYSSSSKTHTTTSSSTLPLTNLLANYDMSITPVFRSGSSVDVLRVRNQVDTTQHGLNAQGSTVRYNSTNKYIQAFTTTNDYLREQNSVALVTGTGFTIFVVAEVVDINSLADAIFCAQNVSDAGRFNIQFTSATTSARAFFHNGVGQALNPTHTYTNNTKFLFSYSYDGAGNHEARVNSTTIATITGQTWTPSTTAFTVLSNNNSTNLTDNHKIYHILVYSTKLSDTIRTQAENYLNTKWTIY